MPAPEPMQQQPDSDADLMRRVRAGDMDGFAVLVDRHKDGLVNYLTAPFYLFDPMDTLDKLHPPSFEAITRAAIRILEFTRGRSAKDMRQQTLG